MNITTKLKPILFGIILFSMILGLTLIFTPEKTKQPKQIFEQNISVDIPPDAVHPGELVTINYVLSVPDENGRIIDTNNPGLAKKYSLKTYAEGDYKLIVGKSGKVSGFDDALIGLRAGETKQVLLPPTQPITRYSLNTTTSLFRTQPVVRTQSFSKKTFEQIFKRKPKINDIVHDKKFPWKYSVTNMTNASVALKILVNEGEELALPGLHWKSKVLTVNTKAFIVRHNPKEGQIIPTDFGPARINVTEGYILIRYSVALGQRVNYTHRIMGIGKSHVFTVTNLTNTTMIITRDDNPAEKKLLLNATILNRELVNKLGNIAE